MSFLCESAASIRAFWCVRPLLGLVKCRLTAFPLPSIGCSRRHRQRHRARRRRRPVFPIRRVLALDLSPQPAPHRPDHRVHHLLHAAEEGSGRLEDVSLLLRPPSSHVLLTRVRKLKAVDFVGILLALAGMTVFILGLTWGGREYAWSSAHVIATLVVGSAVSAAFVAWQWKGSKYPLVPRTPLSPYPAPPSLTVVQFTSSSPRLSMAHA